MIGRRLVTLVSSGFIVVGLGGSALALLSTHFGLGDRDQFFLFKSLGLTRASVLVFSIAALLLTFTIELFVLKRPFLVFAKETLQRRLLACSDRKLFLLVFVLSLGTRLLVLFAVYSPTPQIDASIYISVGQLVAHGIDPYDYSDGLEEREKLQAENPIDWLRDGGKERWNYYVSGNLPLTSLYFGLIEKIHVGNIVLFHRLVYAVVDSIASLLIFILCWRHWPRTNAVSGSKQSERRFYSAIALGSVSPLFVFWGTVFAEDKGLQTLFMVGTMLCLLSGRKLNELLGAALLGMSIAFKALGIFLVPIYFTVLKQRYNKYKPGIAACLIAGLVVLVCFAPFSVNYAKVMAGRVYGNSGIGAGHHSPWVAVELLLPAFYAAMLRYASVVLFAAVLSWSYLHRRLDSFTFWAGALFIFVALFLVSTGLDRVGIAVIVSICAIGVNNPSDGERLAIAQAIIFAPIWLIKALNFQVEGFELANAILALIFVLYFVQVLAKRLFANWRDGLPSECGKL